MSSANYLTPGQLTVPLPAEVCDCEFHATIHPVSGVYPPCIYDDSVELAYNSKGETHYMLHKTDPDREIVMEDGDFFIEKVPKDLNPFDKHDSYIMHYCPEKYWKVYVDEVYMNEHGVCSHCLNEIPPGLIALWKMHNWQYIQDGQGEYGYQEVVPEMSCA